MTWSDDLWRFACGDVLFWLPWSTFFFLFLPYPSSPNRKSCPRASETIHLTITLSKRPQEHHNHLFPFLNQPDQDQIIRLTFLESVLPCECREQHWPRIQQLGKPEKRNQPENFSGRWILVLFNISFFNFFKEKKKCSPWTGKCCN